MEKPPLPEIIREISQSEFAAFKTLWHYMDHRSYLSGVYLRDFFNTPYFLNMFAHVLPKDKGKFPHFKYYLRNIILLTPGEHVLLDQGTEDQRISYSKTVKTADWGKIDILRKDLLSEYNAVFPKMSGIMIMRYKEEEVRDVIRKLNGIFVGLLLQESIRKQTPSKPNNKKDNNRQDKKKNNDPPS